MYIDILRALRISPFGLRKTRLMYKSNINASILKLLVSKLIDLGHIELQSIKTGKSKKGVKTYFITMSGREILKNVQELEKRGIKLGILHSW